MASIKRFFSLSRSSKNSAASSSSSSSRPSAASIFSSDRASIASSSAAPPGSPISMVGLSEFAQVSHKDKKQMLVMASLKAPLVEQKEDQRAPIDICCVLDRSGSMAGEKLQAVKSAMNFLLDNLGPKDQLSVVLYDTKIQTLFDFTPMSDSEKTKARDKIEQVREADMTNLSGGLLKGLELAGKRSKANDVCSILLFTDGLANEGETDTSSITRLMEEQLKKQKKQPTVFTFGFGADHNADMLTRIAETGGGMFYYLKDADAIPISFLDVLGGLSSVCAQNITLTASGLNETMIISSLSAKYRIAKGALPGQSVTLELGDIYSEEGRDILFMVELPALGQASEGFECVSFTLTYFSLFSLTEERVTATASLSRPEVASKDQKVNPELDKQRNRLQVAEAIKVSRETANKGDFDKAKKNLEETIREVKGSASASDPFCENLVTEMDQCLAQMTDRSHYASEGEKVMNRMAQAHYMQRNNKISELEVSFYETSSKVAAKSKFKK